MNVVLLLYNRCNSVAQQYDYTVTYSGVGEPPPASKDVGHCTQIAVFHRINGNSQQNEMDKNKDGDCYESDSGKQSEGTGFEESAEECLPYKEVRLLIFR